MCDVLTIWANFKTFFCDYFCKREPKIEWDFEQLLKLYHSYHHTLNIGAILVKSPGHTVVDSLLKFQYLDVL